MREAAIWTDAFLRPASDRSFTPPAIGRVEVGRRVDEAVRPPNVPCGRLEPQAQTRLRKKNPFQRSDSCLRPLELWLTLAPRRPTLRPAPRFERLRKRPGPIFFRLRNTKPTTQCFSQAIRRCRGRDQSCGSRHACRGSCCARRLRRGSPGPEEFRALGCCLAWFVGRCPSASPTFEIDGAPSRSRRGVVSITIDRSA